MSEICSICHKLTDSEEPAILAIGGGGRERCLCSECERELTLISESHDPSEIRKTMERIGKKMADGGVDDKVTYRTVTELLTEASERMHAIEDGSYDFALDSVPEEEIEIPEELLETEEEREEEARLAEKNAKIDKIVNWICYGMIGAALIFFIYKLVTSYLI